MSNANIEVLRVNELMLEDRGWTRGYATCAFDDYPKGAPGRLEWQPLMLAVLQEIDAGAGYPMHHHENVETITLMLRGRLAHEDSLGARDVTGPDDIAVLSAGSGMDHAELVDGPSSGRAVMFWLRSAELNAPPKFERRTLPRSARRDVLVTVASGRGARAEGAIALRQDAEVLTGALSEGAVVTHALEAGRRAYVLSTDAAMDVNGRPVQANERVLVRGPIELVMRARGATEIALVDLPG